MKNIGILSEIVIQFYGPFYNHIHTDIRNSVSESFIRSIFSPRKTYFRWFYYVIKEEIYRSTWLKKKKKQLYIFSLSLSTREERGTRVVARMGAHPETVQVWKKTNSKLIIPSIREYFNDERLKNIEEEKRRRRKGKCIG